MTRRNALFALCIVALAAGALAARLPGLQRRPMHCDEANQAVRAGWLLETGRYDYDPWDGHGPSLYWLTQPVVRLAGVTSLAETTEWQYRIVLVLFGAGLILLLLLVADGLGRGPAVIAGVLVAISPAMVFYSRYYIQETLLVFFTFAAMACAWRYVCSPRLGWATATGACFGLMHATKETWVLAAFAMTAGLGLTLAWARWREGRERDFRAYLRLSHFLAALVAAGFVAIALYSSFGTNWRGPWDSIAAYATYFRRGGGGGDHAHAWNYYFQVLAAYLPVPGLAWTRWPMIGLAVFCWLAALAAAFRSRHRAPCLHGRCAELSGAGNHACMVGVPTTNVPTTSDFVRFLAFYTFILTVLYCAISYKTPWCLLSFLHGLILLAGVGVWTILRGPSALLQDRPALLIYRVVAYTVFGLAAARLGWESVLLSGKHAVSSRNPLVYNHTSLRIPELAAMMDRLAAIAPEGRDMEIQVVGPEFWPLPWYLRQFHWDRRCADCWWENSAQWTRDEGWNRRPAVVLFDPALQEEMDRKLADGYQRRMSYNLRPGVVLEFYVRGDLWRAYEAATE